MVDVGLLLEGMSREVLEVGAWVNVIGYVGEVDGEGEEGRVVKGSKGGREKVMRVPVQAVMLWSAGGIKVREYEKAVEGKIAMMERAREI